MMHGLPSESLREALDDPQITLGAIAQRLEGVLIGRTVMSCDSFFHAGKFGDDDAPVSYTHLTLPTNREV